MQLKFLGTGTSQGVPVIGCSCNVCTSADQKDHRYRSSVLITTDHEKKILIDCGPDFRMQMLDNAVTNLDAVLLTHEHNDHVIGLDDMRPLIFRSDKNMPIYAQKRVLKEVVTRFPYAFSINKYPGAPSFDLHEIYDTFTIQDTEIQPIRIYHHELPILGFKLKNLAYITDASRIHEDELDHLKNLDYLILNCIRKTNPHPAHFVLDDIMQLNNLLKPKRLYLTHISHLFGKYTIENHLLPEPIQMAYDGLTIEF